MKKMLAVVVSFALLLACMPGAWSEEYVSDVFSPRFFATVYNNSLLLAGRYDEETLDYLIENLILSYTETEEDTVYYDNVDGTSGLFAEYEGREVDVDEYADYLTFFISKEFDQDRRHYVSDIALTIAINYFDQEEEIPVIMNYIMDAYKDSTLDPLMLDGFSLSVFVRDSYYAYLFVPKP